jgi:hypothetical protein
VALSLLRSFFAAVVLALGFWALPAVAGEGAPPKTEVLTTPRFRIHYTPRAQRSAQVLALEIEKARDEFETALGRDWPGVTDVRLGFDREEFDALAEGGRAPGWAVALAYPSLNVILVEAHALTTPAGPQTLRHELAHVALGQLGKDWPRWFHEGLAMHLTGDRFSVNQYSTMFRAVTQERLFSFEHLAESWPDVPSDVEIAYAQSESFVAYLADQHGPRGLGRLLDGVGAGEPFETSFGKAFRTSLWLEELAWKQELPSRYSWWPIITGGSTLWLVIALISVLAYLRRRSQRTAALQRMDLEETIELDLIHLPLADSAGFVPLSTDAAITDSADDLKGKPTLH